MNTIARYILGAALLVPAIGAQAIPLSTPLPNNAVLTFSSGSASGTGSIPGGGEFGFAAASLVSLNGLMLGMSQPTVPGIDQTWSSSYPGIQGNHYTTSSVTVLSASTLDFSGWVMRIFGGLGDYAFGSMQNTATYTFDGTNYAVDYNWSAATNNGGVPYGTLGITSYNVHLTGAFPTSAPPSVPVPGAMWLMGSGLLGLIGCARRKAGCSLG